MKKTRVLFVCLGNICRSPTAEGVFQKKLSQLNLENTIEIDSAGTAAWHAGKSPDTRTIAAASLRGYELAQLRARQVKPNDFYEFDYVLAMDNSNLDDLLAQKPSDSTATVELFLDYANDTNVREVPDPYYGGKDGFETVLDLVENASDGLLAVLQNNK